MATDDAPPPKTYGLSGMKKQPGRKLEPEVIAQQLENLRRGREARKKATPDEERAIMAAPLEHLDKFQRREWEIILRFLADPKLGAKAISQVMGYADHTAVTRILKRPHVQAAIAAVRSAQVAAMIRGDFGAQATLKAAQTKAAVRVVETIDEHQAGPKVRLQAATEVLDRTGLGKSSNVQVHHIHEILTHFTPEELDRYGRGGPPPERFRDVFAALEGPRLLPSE